jgi:hypothetical protein
MQTKPDSDLSSKSRNTKLIHYYCYFYWLAFDNEYLQYTICIFSTLVLKKIVLQELYFPLMWVKDSLSWKVHMKIPYIFPTIYSKFLFVIKLSLSFYKVQISTNFEENYTQILFPFYCFYTDISCLGGIFAKNTSRETKNFSSLMAREN